MRDNWRKAAKQRTRGRKAAFENDAMQARLTPLDRLEPEQAERILAKFTQHYTPESVKTLEEQHPEEKPLYDIIQGIVYRALVTNPPLVLQNETKALLGCNWDAIDAAKASSTSEIKKCATALERAIVAVLTSRPALEVRRA